VDILTLRAAVARYFFVKNDDRTVRPRVFPNLERSAIGWTQHRRRLTAFSRPLPESA
jgi:hypothetical protein